MRLYIAEKPSLARAIATAITNSPQRRQGYLDCGGGVYVSWCVGHLLEPIEPGDYRPEWRRWRMDLLPMIPEDWQRRPKEDVRDQLTVLERLTAQAQEVIHAGDPDREGQLLVDEVLEWCGVSGPVRRVLINDLNPPAVRRALEEESSNQRFAPLKASAEARQRADWLYGINLSRAYTLHHQQQGKEGVFSVGRVQTPVLGLVVARDRAIEDFEPTPWFQLDAALAPPDTPDALFRARWQPGEAHSTHIDEEGRLLRRRPAEDVKAKVTGQDGEITDARFRERNEAPPLPLSLSVLQITAAKRYGLGAEQVLSAAQSLYEKHRLITYPRSDCRYLPEAHWEDRQELLEAIQRNLPDLAPEGVPENPSRRSRAWDDGKVGAHHAIVPTRRVMDLQKLSTNERAVYDLVARFYLMQFEHDAIHREGHLSATIAGEHFRARETGLLYAGWKRLEPVQRRQEAETPKAPLPRLDPGTPVHCHEARCLEKTTRPPLPFTDASLLSAMTGIARFVKDEALRRTLRETDGLGTEATRAAIIQTLFNRDFLYREGRSIHATGKGRALIDGLPEDATTPDRTAIWESRLEAIRQGEADTDAFLTQLASDIRTLIEPARSAFAPPEPEQTGVHCPRCRAPMRRRSGPYGEFWSCSRFPGCKGTRRITEQPDPQDEPQAQAEGTSDGMDQAPVPCPYCYAPLVRRNGRNGPFWGCSRYPGCRTTVPDRDGRPDTRAV
ncbi:DNA topoisomerase III [Halovibrio salipaludis]|uniref:DNA topoisomerase n=1 Tax=Halovibrio salipaludis TaxID=2032626 RepID=A0A2A2F683_9GAMM|nr:DNA topoisomerase III [Halovibrio salipaludis]PAU80177.1 DNA topoisomerase III [Halovibrio salipaludis]